MVTQDVSAGQPGIDLDVVSHWLSWLHGDSNGLIHVCATDNWAGQVCESIEEAVGYVKVMDLNQKSGIYVRATTIKSKLKPGSRGSEKDTACLPALWADLDIAGPGHAQNIRNDFPLPPDEESARRIISNSCLPEPTVWIHSGGGLYPWWMLRDTYCINDEDDLSRVRYLSRSWHEIIAHSARELDLFYGTEVADLARVLRIAGTVNRKVPDNPRMCQISDGGSGLLYSFVELFEAMEECKRSIPAPEPLPRLLPVPVGGGDEGDRPGDAYNQSVEWEDILVPEGWQLHHRIGSTIYWTRPGKTLREGYSATTGRATDADRLYVFSSSTPLPVDTPLTKFAAYTILQHGGDYSTSAGELRRQGFGAPLSHAVQVMGEIQEARLVDEDAPPSPGDSEREPLYVGNTAVAAEWLRDNCGRGKLSGLFMRTGEMVFCPMVGEEGYRATGTEKDFDGPAQVRVVHPQHISGRVQYLYDCYRRDKNGDNVPGMFPMDAARVAVSVPDMLPHLRSLSGVTHTPIIRPDGSVLDQPGYDPGTRLLFLPEPDLKIPTVEMEPDRDAVQAAVEAISRLVQEFPFVTEHDRANFFGLLLTPLIRRMALPPYQMFAITAPMPGSGKTLLASVARIIHGGVFRAEMPEDSAELRKQISSILDVTTSPVVHIDNVTGLLNSPILAGLLTSIRWDDRRLGTNEFPSRVNDRVWIVTGNNVSIGGDLPRRTVGITIDPGSPDPHLRTDFVIRDLEDFVTANRGNLIACLLTMVRAWVVAGCVVPELSRADSYGRWHQVVRGILNHAEVPGVFAHLDSQPEGAGSDESDWSDFLWAVHRIMGERSWTINELLSQTGYHMQATLSVDLLPGNLPDQVYKANGRVSAASRSLGRYLRNHSGRWVNGITVRSSGNSSNNTKVWRLQVLPELRTERLGQTGD